MPRVGQLKVQTLNLWHGQHEYHTRIEAVANRIRIEQPDVLCLQEVVFWDNGTNTAEWLAAETGMIVASAHPQPNNINTQGATIGNAILTRLPIESHGYQPLVPDLNRLMNASAVWFWTKMPYSETPLLVITTHLSWGIGNEYQRLQEAIDINKLTKELTKNSPNAVVVLAGTMNTTPDADTIRFLTGKMAMQGANNFWTDCWTETSTALGETQTPRNLWIRIPAQELGTFDATRIPKRRIDYIFVHDWVAGQTGSPISTKICFSEPLTKGNYPEAPVSDHYGVEAILMDIF
jgi:endonuclease/exonuclease/phosphatase family metal-dependent hydrolase